MPNRVIAISVLCIGFAAFATTFAAETKAVAVDLDPVVQYQVLGAPVVLNVTLKNVGDRDVMAWVDRLSGQIQIYLAPEGQVLRRFTEGTRTFYEIQPSVERVAPGQSKAYALRVLYTWYARETEGQRSHLAFEEPGDYELKVRYPLFPNRQMFESNTIQVHIARPKGLDAAAWRQLNRREMLHFLQTGIDPESPDVIERCLRVLKAFPKSSYDTAIRWALEKHYRKRTYPMLKLPPEEARQLEKIREILAIQ